MFIEIVYHKKITVWMQHLLVVYVKAGACLAFRVSEPVCVVSGWWIKESPDIRLS